MMDGHRHSGIRTMRSFAHAELRRLSSALLMIGLFALCLPGLFAQTPAVAESIVIRAGKLFDAESGQLTDHAVIVITGNRIASVGSGNVPVPLNARVIDLGDATVLPGFIDVHTHLTSDAGNAGYESLGISSPRAALIGAKNARLTLLPGFTSGRNVGAEGYANVPLRDPSNAGDAIGPRLHPSRPPLRITASLS